VPPHLGGPKIYSVPIAGGDATLLSPADVNGRIYDFQISGDSTRVVYTADHIRSARPELFSVPIDGGTIVKLNSSSSTASRNRVPDFSPDQPTDRGKLFPVGPTGRSCRRSEAAFPVVEVYAPNVAGHFHRQGATTNS
jgi:hypothetical protein